MFSRSTIRSFRSLSSQISRRSLSTSTSSASSSTFSRNAAIGITTLAVAGLTITSERRRVLNDDRVRESVLDQGSLKEPIHKREGATKSNNNTDKIKSNTETLSEKAKDVKNQIIEKTQDVKEQIDERFEKVEDETINKIKETKSKVENKTDEASHLIEEKSEEAIQPSQGAFNEETGEINWDCPCLGGMADGPCGEQFKEAFSCFIYSEAEPKGVDCVEKFKHMQDCFREHPEIYGEEIDDDETDLADAPIPADDGVTVEDVKAPFS